MSTREQLLDHGDGRQQGEVKPYRAQINLTAAHMDPQVIAEMLDGLEDDAEKRGFIVSWSFVGEMPLEDVVPDSELDLIIKGEEQESEGEVWPENPPQPRN